MWRKHTKAHAPWKWGQLSFASLLHGGWFSELSRAPSSPGSVWATHARLPSSTESPCRSGSLTLLSGPRFLPFLCPLARPPFYPSLESRACSSLPTEVYTIEVLGAFSSSGQTCPATPEGTSHPSVTPDSTPTLQPQALPSAHASVSPDV